MEIYGNAHLFQLKSQNRLPILEKISKVLGVTSEDLKHFELFAQRMMSMTELAQKNNCLLYIDAEQTYMQRGIESIA